MKTVTMPKTDNMTLTIEVDVTKVARGHMVKRGGRHADKRKKSRNNSKADFRKEC